MSFVTDTGHHRVRVLDNRDWFDVPRQAYGPGNITGMQAFAEFMGALKRHDYPYPAAEVLEAACLARSEPAESTEQPNRRGAGVGFVFMVEHVLRYAARSGQFDAWIAYAIERQKSLNRQAPDSDEGEVAHG
jgi:hypothetical protein